MKLISFDVGLRNLAVCVLEGTSRTDVQIRHWDVIDVLGEKNGVERPRCFQCAKPAMWQQTGKYACTKHCPKVKTLTKTALTKKTNSELAELYKSLYATEVPKLKKELVNAVASKYNEIGWSKFSGGANIRHAPVLDLARDIAACLDTRVAWWKNTDLIVVENQKDRRMFAVQAMIHMYFAAKGFKVKGVSAIHKLNNILTLDSTATYKARKKTGITHCQQLMPSNQAAFFASHKKKDDLADSFLQGLWFLEH
jgi:hypothetical protein